MTNELSTTLAASIIQAHEEAKAIALQARDNIAAALNKAADVGVLVDEAAGLFKGGLNQWLRENVPTLAIEQAEVYRGIHKVRAKRSCLEADTRQLKLIGIIGDDEVAAAEGTATAQRAGHGRWIKWAGHVVHHFEEVERTRPIEQWEPFERKALADQLKPIAELWGRANS